MRPLSQTGERPGDDKLFWLRAAVQSSPYWFFVDTGSATNIVDKKFYFSLPFHPAPGPTDPRERLISGHNTALPVIGEVVLPFSLHNKQYYHLFRVVENFPVDLCLGADFMKAHECCLSYEKGRNEFQIKKFSCPVCSENFSRVSTQAQVGPPIALKKEQIILPGIPAFGKGVKKLPVLQKIYPLPVESYSKFFPVKKVTFNLNRKSKPLKAPETERPASPVAKSILRITPVALDPAEEEVKSKGFTASSPDPAKLYSHFTENSCDYSVFHAPMETLELSRVRPGPAKELLISQLPSFEGGGEVLEKTLAPGSPALQAAKAAFLPGRPLSADAPAFLSAKGDLPAGVPAPGPTQ